MKIENLVSYEISQRAIALNKGPDSSALKLADAAFELLHNEEFTNNPLKFLATPTNFNSPPAHFKLTLYHKSVIMTVYGISFRNIM